MKDEVAIWGGVLIVSFILNLMFLWDIFILTNVPPFGSFIGLPIFLPLLLISIYNLKIIKKEDKK